MDNLESLYCMASNVHGPGARFLGFRLPIVLLVDACLELANVLWADAWIVSPSSLST
jgi:hypothetical protein